jgi:hypothetical protein
MMTRGETLAFAEELIRWNVPVLVCKQQPGGDGMIPIRSWSSVTNAEQCREDLKKYVHGEDALALIGGYGIDLIDVDAKDDGTIEPFGDFKNYGVTRTPSGGWHYVITSTGLPQKQKMSVNGVFVGDYVGGTAGHNSRRIGYLPGSYRPNKYGDVQYEMESPWDIEGAVLAEVDERVKEILTGAIGVGEREEAVYVDDSPERPESEGVDPEAQRWIDEEIQRLKDAPWPWSPGSYWDTTTFEVACALIRVANSHWSGYTLEQAREDLLEYAPSDDVWGRRQHMTKWRSAREAVGAGGRVNPRDPHRDFVDLGPGPVQLSVDVSNPDDAYQWLKRFLGKEGTPLAGMFRRGDDLVHTPRVGEEGYVEPPVWIGPKGPVVQTDGPAQVQRMTTTTLIAHLANYVRVFRTLRTVAGQIPALFPPQAAVLAIDAPRHLSCVRPLTSVTHTPLIRDDGTLLGTPGYDEATRMLYLPEPGLVIPRMSKGLALIDELVCDFEFVSEGDRANYLALLLTPLLRQFVRPPYPLFAIGAPQPGSGKSLLAEVVRAIHGGVFRSEMPRDKAELRKQITALLDTTSAPVITFDNLSGVLRSPQFDGLLTSAEWSDRILGVGKDRTLPNDRIWTITGNNLILGGDLRRRTIWITIDPKMEHPEERTGFVHEELVDWIVQERGEILASLLGLIVDWYEDGAERVVTRTDSFGAWQATVSGILRVAGVPGEVNARETVREDGLADEDDWGTLLAAIERRFGLDEWTVSEVVGAIEFGEIGDDVLPEAVVERGRRGSLNRALGDHLRVHSNRWAGGRTVVRLSRQRNNSALWRVLTPETDVL